MRMVWHISTLCGGSPLFHHEFYVPNVTSLHMRTCNEVYKYFFAWTRYRLCRTNLPPFLGGGRWGWDHRDVLNKSLSEYSRWQLAQKSQVLSVSYLWPPFKNRQWIYLKPRLYNVKNVVCKSSKGCKQAIYNNHIIQYVTNKIQFTDCSNLPVERRSH